MLNADYLMTGVGVLSKQTTSQSHENVTTTSDHDVDVYGTSSLATTGFNAGCFKNQDAITRRLTILKQIIGCV